MHHVLGDTNGIHIFLLLKKTYREKTMSFQFIGVIFPAAEAFSRILNQEFTYKIRDFR